MAAGGIDTAQKLFRIFWEAKNGAKISRKNSTLTARRRYRAVTKDS
jgi:hypothetical protein